jgi:uncharacterized protein (DUF2236 family)
MDASRLLEDARALGSQAASSRAQRARLFAQRRLRLALGLRGDPPPACDDPLEAYLPPDGAARLLHADLPAMLIGGIASLLLQSLHPGAMAGVAEHSNYAADPLGRLERTARFVGVTTFGSKQEASRAIERVRRLHDSVAGVDEQLRPYRASDPALLTWVHAAEVACFAEAHRRYGALDAPDAFYDAYLGEMELVARDLGATHVPTSVCELDEYLSGIRPELEVTSGTREVRQFLLMGVGRLPHQVVAHQAILAAARGVLPRWAAEMLELEALPLEDRLVVRPLAHGLARALRLVVPTPDASWTSE